MDVDFLTSGTLQRTQIIKRALTPLRGHHRKVAISVLSTADVSVYF